MKRGSKRVKYQKSYAKKIAKTDYPTWVFRAKSTKAT